MILCVRLQRNEVAVCIFGWVPRHCSRPSQTCENADFQENPGSHSTIHNLKIILL